MRIIVTVGPSSNKIDTLHKLKDAGADIFRLNLSHLNEESLTSYFEIMNMASITPALDTQGSQIRILNLTCPLEVKEGEILTLSSQKSSKENYLQLNHEEIFKEIEPFDILKIDFDGLVTTVVSVSNEDHQAEIKALNSGVIFPNRAIDVVNKKIKLDHLSSFDKHAISLYGEKSNEIYLSFTENKDSVQEAKTLITNGPQPVKFISKIETKQGIENIEEILEVSDGILIDRGDLSREISMSQLPVVTNELNNICKRREKPFFVATSILDTMMKQKLPSRSEISDLHNMLEKGIDGIVLAAEVAIGQNPIDSVRVVNFMHESMSSSKSKAASHRLRQIKNDLPVHLSYWL